jgi:outer membrane protein assembly factor BamE (lipoprotein component of BamABCDE complex)
MSHSNTAQLYPANFDDSEFAKRKNNEFNRLNEDLCYNQEKDKSNQKKLKFVTTNHIDLLEAKEKQNFFGIGIRDQLFVPGEQIDAYSSLINGESGSILTNCNVRNGFGQLPVPTTPYRGQVSRGDVLVEDLMRNNIEVRKNSCLPRDTFFHNRSFYIFDDKLDIQTPQAIKSVETPQIGFELGRNGVPSRFMDRFAKNNYVSYGGNFKPMQSTYKFN